MTLKLFQKISNSLHFKKKISTFYLIPLFGIFISCNPTKKLLPNEYLLEKVEVINAKETNQPKENFEAFYRQKPNRKLFSKLFLEGAKIQMFRVV